MIFTCVLQEVNLRQGNFKSHTSKYPDNYLVGPFFSKPKDWDLVDLALKSVSAYASSVRSSAHYVSSWWPNLSPAK